MQPCEGHGNFAGALACFLGATVLRRLTAAE
jgi:hypothetical protein